MTGESMVNDSRALQVFDFIGIGFGPSNLAMAITAQEERERGGRGLRALFLDNRDGFQWHPGMLLEDSRLQVVFLKDLVTMRNPRSRYTFVNYLYEKGRLHDFINLRTFYPTRIEFDDYYRWVADQFQDQVRYRHQVTAVLPQAREDGSVELLKVVARDLETGAETELLTRHLTIGTGGTPWVPRGVELRPDGRAFHSSECMQRLERDYPDRNAPYRFIVVGSGQTSADIFYFLINKYPNAQVTSTLRQFAFKPQDDTHFVNELFFPHVVDLLYGLPEGKRKAFMDKHRDVTHSAVDMDLIPLIYDAVYNDKMLGRNRLAVRPFLDLTGARHMADHLVAQFRHVMTGETVEIAADALIMGTGYKRKTPIDLLRQVDPYLTFTDGGEYRVARSYCIERSEGFQPRIYLQGYCESTHGFSEVLLSLLPVRSAEILEDMIEALDGKGEAAGWSDFPVAATREPLGEVRV